MSYYTDEQKKVISHDTGHMLVRAVPGSGKTKTLVGRIFYLIKKKSVPPGRILVLMFNRNARDSFSTKLSAPKFNIRHDKKGTSNSVRVCTFHSMALEELKKAASRGYINPFKGESDEDKQYREHLLRVALKNYIDRDSDEYRLVQDFTEVVRGFKAECYNPYLDTPDEPSIQEKAYKDFETDRQKKNIRTEDDWIPDLVDLLTSSDFQLPYYQYVLIDEYQDINVGQNRLLLSLCRNGSFINAVGDEDQCIYSWRGSRPDLMDLTVFARSFPQTSSYTLSTTFRFGHKLALVANSIINNNKDRERKLCISHPSTPHTKVSLVEDKNAGVELIRLIQQLAQQNVSLNDICILTRNNAQLATTQLLMRLFHIPHVAASYYEKSNNEVACAVGLLMHFFIFKKLCPAGMEQEAFISGFLNGLVPYLKKSHVAEISQKIARDDTVSLCRIIEKAGQELHKQPLQHLAKTLEKLNSIGINQQSCSALTAFRTIVEHADLYSLWEKKPSSNIDSNHRVRILDLFDKILSENQIDPLIFIKQLINPTPLESSSSVRLMTCHRSKGLEFPIVIMADLYDEQFPAGNFALGKEGLEDSSNLEEERRLFYVGATRAIKELFLITPPDPRLSQWVANPKTFSHPSKGEVIASRFIYESKLHELNSYGEQLYSSGNVVLKNDKNWLVKKYLKDYRYLSRITV